MGRPAVAVPFRRPDRTGARMLIEGDHRRCRAAGSANQSISVDQHRLAVSPSIPFLPSKVAPQTFAPFLRAAGRVETNQIAERGDDINEIAIHSRRAAGTLPGRVTRRPRLARLGAPNSLTGLPVETNDVFILVAGVRGAVAQRENPIAGDGQAGVTAPRAPCFPNERWTVRRPFRQKPGLFGNARAIRAAKRGPIACPGRQCHRKRENKHGRQCAAPGSDVEHGTHFLLGKVVNIRRASRPSLNCERQARDVGKQEAKKPSAGAL
jgi:hypothetical protein